MGAMNRLYLVRHGENLANLTLEFSHHKIDYSLTEKGVLQAQQTAGFFADKDIHGVYSSPLKRAAETAAIIAARLHLPVVLVEEFREVNVGVLEDPPFQLEKWTQHDHIMELWFAGHPEARFPGGEDYHELWNRTQAGLEQVLAGKSGRNIIVVGHGGMFTFTAHDLCPGVEGMPLRDRPNHNASISEILAEWRDGRLVTQLATWASVDHLHGAAAELARGAPQPEDLARLECS
jgi:broad specificity phosphatase PhoE